MKTVELDAEEKHLLDSYEGEDWRSVRQLETEKKRYGRCAAAASRKDVRVKKSPSAD